MTQKLIHPVHLHGLGTVVPPHALPQTLVETRARAILGPRYKTFERMAKTFKTSGVKTRYSVVPIDWFETPHDWPERNSAYLRGALDLFVGAAEAALSEAGWTAEQVDVVLTVSSTGIATPTLEARALARMDFRPDIIRVPVFGLGCAGGVSGMGLAHDMAAARPGAKVLLVVVEACTLAFRDDRMQKADIIATVLFGDGAAAACMSTDEGPIRVAGSVAKTWPGTLDIMGWDVDATGFGVVFDRSIPAFTHAEFDTALGAALVGSGLTKSDVDRFVCHPGGAKVIEAIEGATGMAEGTLDVEREIIAGYGNMSAPTVLFVLDRVLKSGQTGQLMTCALGPGFTAAFQPVHVG